MDVVTARPTELDRYAALARTTGIIGIAFLVLLFGPIIALASADEPALEATAAEAVNYFRNLEATWAQLTMAASTLGMIGSLWFFVAFGFLLRRAEGDPPWRSTIATLSGALLAAFGLIGASWEAASLHGGRITPEVADYAYAFGNVGFANIWIAHGQFRRLLRLGDPLHGRARTLDGLVDRGCRSRPGGCQVRVDGRVLGRWLRAVLAVDHRGLYPTDRAARPVEQSRTLRSAALALTVPVYMKPTFAPGAVDIRGQWRDRRTHPQVRNRGDRLPSGFSVLDTGGGKRPSGRLAAIPVLAALLARTRRCEQRAKPGPHLLAKQRPQPTAVATKQY